MNAVDPLAEAVRLAREAADLAKRAVGVGRPALAEPLDGPMLIALVDAYMAVFDAQDEADMPALENALTWAAALASRHPHDVPSRVRDLLDGGDVAEVLDDGLDIWLEHAAESLRHWRADGDAAALVHAEQMLRSCLSVCGDHRNRFAFASNLATVFRGHHARTSDPAWIASAVVLARAAVRDSPTDPREVAGLLTNLSIALLDAFDSSGDPELMAESVAASRRAAEVGGQASDDDRLLFAGNLVAVLLRSHEETEDPGALREAVDFAERLLTDIPETHPSFASLRSNLAVALARIAQDRSEPALAAHRALGLAVGAVRAEGNPVQRARYQANVCVVARNAFSVLGDAALLRSGIEHGRAALAVLGPGGAASAGLANNLATLLRDLAQSTGDLTALDEASDVLRDVLAVTPEGHPDLVLLHGAAAGVAFARYEYTGELAQARRGVELLRAVVGSVPAGHPLWKTVAADLSGLLHVLFLRTDEDTLLDASIALARAVLAGPVPPHAAASLHANLGATLQQRYLLHADPADLLAAVAEGEAALGLLPAGSLPPGHRHNLSNSLRYLAHATGDPAAWQRARDLSRAAVAAAPLGSPARAVYLMGLANALTEAPEANAQDRRDAAAALEQATSSPVAALTVRVRAARALAELHARGGRWPEAGAVLAQAVGLLRGLAPWHLARHDQERHLGRVTGLGPDAAAAALSDEQAARAVELLEDGRGVLFSYGLLDRAPEPGRGERRPWREAAPHARGVARRPAGRAVTTARARG
jgi:hypothetical protein